MKHVKDLPAMEAYEFTGIDRAGNEFKCVKYNQNIFDEGTGRIITNSIIGWKPRHVQYQYLMYITCKETGENITEVYGDSEKDLIAQFENEFGELYCAYEIMPNQEG